MKTLSLTHKLPTRGSIVALTLFIGTLAASALQVSNSAANGSAPGNSRPSFNTLAPAAPVSPKVYASTDSDIRDIRQPRHLPTVKPWVAVVAGAFFLGAAAFAAWRWTRPRPLRQMLAHEVALQWLDNARQLMDPDHAREYCFAVSSIIRSYIEERFHVHAPRLTTEEFLRDLVEVRDTMLEPHRVLLGQFLAHCDLAKFAGWRYSMPDLEAMHASGRSFVQHTALAAPTVTPQPSKPQLALTAS
jgi:hypothetical protein